MRRVRLENGRPVVSPLDFLKPDTEFADAATVDYRFSICNQCPELIAKILVCKKCGCFMSAKTKLAAASCPLGKW